MGQRCLELLDCIHYNKHDTGIEDTLVKWGKAHGSEVQSVFGVRGNMGTDKDWKNIKEAFGPEKYTGIDVDKDHATIPNPAYKRGGKEPEKIPNPEYREEMARYYDRDIHGDLQPRWKEKHGRARSEFMGQDYRFGPISP